MNQHNMMMAQNNMMPQNNMMINNQPPIQKNSQRNLQGNNPQTNIPPVKKKVVAKSRTNKKVNSAGKNAPKPKKEKKSNDLKESTGNSNFEKKHNPNVDMIKIKNDSSNKGDPYRNDYMSPIEREDIHFEISETRGVTAANEGITTELMLSKESSKIKSNWKKETVSEEITKEFNRLGNMISIAEKGKQKKDINWLLRQFFKNDLITESEMERDLWKLFLGSEIMQDQVVLLENEGVFQMIEKLIEFEIIAQIHNDMDLLALLFKWLFEIICLPQFENELLHFLDSEMFVTENRYFDDSQLDMSEICVNSTDISSIIQDTRVGLGFKIWKTTIFTISAYENEEIMEHCHKIISYMRQKAIGSIRSTAMTGITEEGHEEDHKGRDN